MAGKTDRLPEFVGHFARWLESICPTLGKVRIAQVLGRAGLQLGATTVGRMLNDGDPVHEARDVALSEEEHDGMVTAHVVRAKYPDYIWHIDLTVVPTTAGFWVPWIPFSKPLGPVFLLAAETAANRTARTAW